MTTIESTSSTGNGCTAGKDSAQRLFIASKTVANVLAEVKPLPYRQLVDLPSTATMEEAFDVFLAEDILSAPVYRLVGGRKEYITIVSVLDLLKLLGSHTDEQSNALLKPLSEAIGLTEESSHLVTVKPSDPLEYVMDLFSRLGAHRVLVQGEEQPVLLSQMDVARYLQAQNHHLGHILDITTPTIVERARARQGLPLDAPVSSITFKSTAMEAFLKIANHKQYISALCILDDDNTMVSDLSPENLRGLNRDRFDSLQKPIIMYLKECDGELYPPLSCHDRFTLSQIMTAFVLRKAHRLWWCDDEGHVKGVITLSDLLGTFIDSTL